jgi:hypothetical protein
MPYVCLSFRTHVLFLQDPPDEVHLGAKFLGGIPFPFITIRTNKLEVNTRPRACRKGLVIAMRHAWLGCSQRQFRV